MKPKVEFLASVKRDFGQIFFIGVINTFTNTNLEMSVLIKREKRSVRVYVCSSQMVRLCYCICGEKR